MIHNEEELKRLHNRLYELDQQYEKAKLTRTLATTLFFAIATMLIICIAAKPQTAGEIFAILLVSVVIGAIEYWICFSIFTYSTLKSQEENAAINRIKEEIARLEAEEHNK